MWRCSGFWPEERHVPRRDANVVEVAGAEALLAGGGPGEVGRPGAEELLLELVHPRPREEQRGVVVRNERVGGDDAVVALAEEIEEAAADLVGRHIRLL